MRVALLALSCLVALACVDDEPSAVKPVPEPAQVRENAPPPVAQKVPPPAALPATISAPVASSRAPLRGCAQQGERVLSEARRVLVAHDQGGLSVLILAPDARTLVLLRGASLASLEETARRTLSEPVQRITFARGALGLRAVWVDATGRVLLAHVGARELATERVLGDGADRRFAPAYAVHDGQEVVAFTRTVNEAMHTFVARIDSTRVTLRDITPDGHGAAAATFVLGASPPRLVAIDAHAGVSPLLELSLDPGTPAIVRTPVSQPYTPPWLAAVLLGDDVQVAYTAVGKLAATAVGRVSLGRAGDAVALLPSRGYGELACAAALGPTRALFAMESPRSEQADAPRSLALTLLDGEGEGPSLVLAAEGPSATLPSLAVGSARGELWLGFVRDGRAVISALQCDF